MFDYEVLRLIWWVLLGVLLIGFAITDGFDMGVGAVLPFVGKTDLERRVVINSIAPTWEGNQVWLILGGGAIFAAWPALYALSFSGFYLAMFVVLAALILRPVAFKYRSKEDSPKWRNTWDWALFIGGAVPALIFGVAVGNVLQGVPFHLTEELRPIYEGGFFGLLNPYALLCGLLSVAMLVLHGTAWLTIKTTGEVQQRARRIGTYAALATIGLFAFNGLILALFIDGYAMTGEVDTLGPSNPLLNPVERASGAWFTNYGDAPLLLLAPLLGFAGPALALLGLRAGREIPVFLGSKLGCFGIISTVGVSMFPIILPSSTEPNSSLTVWDASSSETTMGIMLFVTVVFLPIVLLYTAWAFRIMWGKVTEEQISANSHSVY